MEIGLKIPYKHSSYHLIEILLLATIFPFITIPSLSYSNAAYWVENINKVCQDVSSTGCFRSNTGRGWGWLTNGNMGV